jgi:hypothetical protein
MNKKVAWLQRLLFSALVALPTNVAYAGQVEATDASIVWQAGIDGVEIEWGSDGSFSRIYSRFSQPVEFPDRRGIYKAQVIAEEKAKAAIVRFLEQEVATARVVAEVDNDISTASLTKGTSQAEDVKKNTQRQMISSLTEVTSSVAAGSLRGVIVLERGYDEKQEVAWVKVGISKKSMAASAALGKALEGEPSPEPTQGGQQTPGSSFKYAPSGVQRSQQKDW